MKKLLFTGAATALVTPMGSDGSLNLEKYKELIEFQIGSGIDALVAVATTGENAVLSGKEHRSLMRCAVEAAAGRVPVICSTGSNDTAYGSDTSKAAEDAGADGLLLVTPYYNKCTQAGLIKHFEKILSNTSLPAIVYNVPSRTGFNISVETYKILSQHPQIVGVKEASGNVAQAAAIIAECKDELAVYSGNDELTVPIMSIGGKGVISVMSNIIPSAMHSICSLCLNNDFAAAKDLAVKYLSLANAMFLEVNPIPVKAAMNMLGFDVGDPRLPLTQLDQKYVPVLCKTLEQCGLSK